MGRNFIDLTGQIFGRLTIIEYIGKTKYKQSLWLCRCNCGNEKVILGLNLNHGRVKSCGCIVKEGNNFKHGFSHTKSWQAWDNMKQRCLDSNHKQYKDYGGRGIKVCDRWLKFENFLKDVGEISPELTLDRINNNGNYEPDNFKLSTRKEQQRNTRFNNLITYKNKIQCLSAWAEEHCINYNTLYQRLYIDKWPIEKALLTPVRKKNEKKNYGVVL